MSNTLGDRRYFEYISDTDQAFKYLTDEDLGTAVGGTLNDTNPDLPRRFRPRGVYVQDADGNRKFLVCGKRTLAAYASNASSTVTIDETEFKTTGRKGEQVSFGANPSTGGTTPPAGG